MRRIDHFPGSGSARTRQHLNAPVAEVMARSIRGAVDSLNAISAQFPGTDSRLSFTALQVEQLASELSEIPDDNSTGRPSVGPSKLSSWHSAVFQVSSSSPRVLQTVGLNALRVLIQMYDDVLGSDGSDQLLEVARRHKELLHSLRQELAEDLNG